MRRLLLIAIIAVLCAGGFVSAEAAAPKPVPFPTSPQGLKSPAKLPKELDAVARRTSRRSPVSPARQKAWPSCATSF